MTKFFKVVKNLYFCRKFSSVFAIIKNLSCSWLWQKSLSFEPPLLVFERLFTHVCQDRGWYLLYLSPFVMPIQTLSSTNNPVSSFSSISSSRFYLGSLSLLDNCDDKVNITQSECGLVLVPAVPPSTAAILLMINSPLVPRGLTPLDQNTVKHSQKISPDLPSLVV